MPTDEELAAGEALDDAVPRQSGFTSAFNFLAGKANAIGRILTSGRLSESNLAGTIDSVAGSVVAASKQTILATAAAFTGLDPTGTTNSKTALQNAIYATPDGGVLEIRAGTYLCQGGTSLLNLSAASGGYRKSITVRANGPVTFINDMDVPLFDFAALFADEMAVSAITSVDIPSDNSEFTLTTKGVQLTVAAAPAWKRGDLVRLVADDAIAEDRPAVGGSVAREGQVFRVHSSVGTTIILQGALLGSFTTGIRVAKYSTIKTVLEGFTYDITDARAAANTGAPFASLRAMVGVEVRDVEARRLSGPGMSLEGLAYYLIDGYRVGFGYDDPGASKLGYGINDKSCSFGRITGLLCGAVRHAYTTNTSQIAAASASTHAYGRSYFTSVNGKVMSATNAAFDTHHGAYGIHFHDCQVLNAPVGFQIRGVRNMISNAYTKDCQTGIKVYEESGGGYTRHTVVDGALLVDSIKPIEEIHDPAGTTRETTATTYRNIDAQRATSGLSFKNATASIFGLREHMATVCVDSSAAIYSDGSVLSLFGGVSIDYFDTTTGATLRMYDCATSVSSTFECEFGLKLRHQGIVTTMIRNSTNTIVRVKGIEATQLPSTVVNATPVTGSYVEYQNLGNLLSSEYLAITGSGMATASNLLPIGRTTQRRFYAELDPSGTNRTLATLPDALRRGMVLTIMNRGSANTITLTHGGNLVLNGATDKVLSAGQSIQLTFGIEGWRQTAAVY